MVAFDKLATDNVGVKTAFFHGKLNINKREMDGPYEIWRYSFVELSAA